MNMSDNSADKKKKTSEFGRVLNPKAPEFTDLRQRLGLSQSQFADRFGLSIRTVQQWEQGRSQPDQPARVLLALISSAPDEMQDLIDRLFAEIRTRKRTKTTLANRLDEKIIEVQLSLERAYLDQEPMISDARPEAVWSDPNRSKAYAA
jgi:putative transcriptional regulator